MFKQGSLLRLSLDDSLHGIRLYDDQDRKSIGEWVDKNDVFVFIETTNNLYKILTKYGCGYVLSTEITKLV